MALFKYQAFSKQGITQKGTIDASSPEAAREQLVRSGLYPISIVSVEQKGAERTLLGRIFARKVTVSDKILFTKQLSILLKSGVPLLQALELLSEQFAGQLASIIIHLKDTIKEGGSLAQGMAEYPKVFDNIYVQLVRAGEASGKLEAILERLVDYIERRQEIVKRVRGALRYPLIQLGVILLVVGALLMFVVPTLTERFVAQGMQLPLPTQILMSISSAITSYWYIILIVVGALYLGFRYWRSTPSGGRIIDTFKLKVPIVKFFARMGTVVQFCRTLGILLESGVNLSESLDIVVNLTDNRVLSDALDQAREKIIKQGRISEFLRESGVFPPIAIYLIKTGEQSGQLDAMLLTVARNYEADMADYADNLSSMVEPIMMLIMGVIVGFVVLSVALPMMQQAQLYEF